MRNLLSRRRVALAVLTLALAAPAAASLPSPAQADDSSTLTVVGTSDVFDSNLVQSVLKPGFEKAYPGVTLNYVSRGTSDAIALAQAGTASAMIVHAASLENQFVAAGYSLEPYGRAIFYGDYVLLGPASDPAGVLNGSSNDIVGAFQKIATAGAAGNATFLSRASQPGTTVQEHAIWGLTSGSAVQTCNVSAANGGGKTPTTSTDANCPSPTPYPTWYSSSAGNQAANVQKAESCPAASYPNGNCYVLTDRGTYNYLQATGAVTNLKIVTRDNSATAIGGPDLLINSFHAYAVNPARVPSGSQLNTKGATDFLNWVTSPAAQAAVGAYLNGGGDAPFLPSAAPAITASSLPASVKGGKRLTVTGTLRNVVPGTPTLNGVKVTLMARPASSPDATPVQVKSAVTSTTGAYSVSYKPKRSMTYAVAVGAITKIENQTLSPVFGDLLAPASLTLGTVKVKGGLKVRRATVNGAKRTLSLVGALKPGAANAQARIKLYVAKPGKGLVLQGTKKLRVNAQRFDVTFTVPRGTYKYQVRYVNAGVIKPGRSATKTVTVP